MEGCLAVHLPHVEQQVGVEGVDHHLVHLLPASSSLRISSVTAGKGGESKFFQG